MTLRWPGGQEVVVQARPSNADEGGYAGSLDFILPDDRVVTNFQGDELTPAPPAPKGAARTALEVAHNRIAKQLVTDMHDDWYVSSDDPAN